MAKYPPSAYDDASLFSDISSLEGSDDFGRKLLQHTKDAQRISNLNSHSQAFRKAKPLPRAALNLDNLERNNLRDPPNHATNHYRPPSVASSNTSDPPLNPPREWGRKGRQNHSWMRQIYNEGQNGRVAPPQEQSPNIDWINAANDKLDSSVHVSPSLGRAAITSTPTSLRQQQDSHVDHWDSDPDFSAASLLASTPALPSRTRLTVEEIRQREIQTAATGSSFYRRQAQQQTMSETLTRRFGDSSAEAAAISRSASAPGAKASIANKENIPVQDTNSLHGYYRSIETYKPVVSDTPRPSQRRTDSMALLRRLSRTPSASPSPTPAKETLPPARSKQKEPERSEVLSKSITNHNTDHMRLRGDSPQASEVVTGLHPVSLPQGDSSQAPEVLEPSNHAITPIRSTEQNLPAQTPEVMGGWVDTPQTTVRTTDRITSQAAPGTLSQNPQPGDMITDAIRPRTRSEPNLPVSALDAVLKNLRDGTGKEDDDPTIGDSTIASLEEVMNPSADNTQRLDLPNVPSTQPRSYSKDTKKVASVEQQQKNNGEEAIDAVPTTQEQRDARQKWFALEGLKKRFSGTSAKDKPFRETRKTKSPEEGVAASQSASTPSLLVETESPHIHRHAAGTHCAQCGRPTSVFRAAWLEYWGLYFQRDSQSRLGIRLTWFGLACALFWGWLITELILGRIFTPPLYAATMKGYGVDPDAPRFPYVLPTLILRPFSPILTPLMSLATWASTAVFGEPEFKYYPASPGAWGPAAKVRIRPPGPRSAYHTGTDRTAHVVWSDEETVPHGWHSDGKVQKMNVWSEGQVAWEADEDGSMLEDEVI